jgi:ankyrin repeat protein
MARKKAAVKAASRPQDAYGQLLFDMWRDDSVLQRQLNSGHSFDMRDSQGKTLHYRACGVDVEALTKGSDTLVKQLLQAGADSNFKCREGLTPLMVTWSLKARLMKGQLL